jgi:membrane associated rhomboid family serine protease
MLLIPIAQEHSTVRRYPWVSWAIIALCTFVLTAFEVLGSQHANRAELARTANKIQEHLARHPYLTVPSSLRPLLPGAFVAAVERAGRRLAERGRLPEPGRLSREQAELDELGRHFEQTLRALPEQRWGYVPARASPVTVVTSMFMHGGWMHLLGNMLFLFLSGPFVEDVYGRPLFASFYLAAGIVATLTHGLAEPTSLGGLVGASGAIAGVMGAFLVRFTRRRIEFLFMPIFPLPFFWRVRTHFFMPAFVVLPFWFLQQLLFAGTGDSSGTAWWAHVGGFAFGVVVAGVIRVSRIEERFIDPRIEAQVTLAVHPSMEKAIDARVAGDFALAQTELARVLSSEPDHLDAWTERYELALARADAAETGRTAERLLDILKRKGEHELAAQLIDDQRWHVLGAGTPRFYLSAAAQLEKDGDFRRALEFYGEVARLVPNDGLGLRALIRRGELFAHAGNARDARAAFEAARAHPAFGPLWSEGVARGLAALGGERRG